MVSWGPRRLPSLMVVGVKLNLKALRGGPSLGLAWSSPRSECWWGTWRGMSTSPWLTSTPSPSRAPRKTVASKYCFCVCICVCPWYLLDADMAWNRGTNTGLSFCPQTGTTLFLCGSSGLTSRRWRMQRVWTSTWHSTSSLLQTQVGPLGVVLILQHAEEHLSVSGH